MSITLLQGDCLEIMPTLEAASVDLVLCDLPYGTSACKWDSAVDIELLWVGYHRLTRLAGAQVLTASQPFTAALSVSNLPELKYALVWEKSRVGGFLDAKFRPLKAHEDVLVFSRAGCSNGSKTPMTYNPQGLLPCGVAWTSKRGTAAGIRTPLDARGIREFTGYPRSVIHIDSEKKTVHPTQKPVALMEYLIRTYTNPGDMVLDNCMGSGTTGVACVNTGRNFVGIEKDAGYFSIAQKRISEAQFKR